MSILNSIIAQSAEQFADTVSAISTVATPTATVSPEPVELSMWELCMKGGFIMIPLAILLIISIYIFIERYTSLSGPSTGRRR